jgi:hypothetical protein
MADKMLLTKQITIFQALNCTPVGMLPDVLCGAAQRPPLSLLNKRVARTHTKLRAGERSSQWLMPLLLTKQIKQANKPPLCCCCILFRLAACKLYNNISASNMR